MPDKKKAIPRKAKELKSYPSVAQMVADISSPKFAVKFLADCIHDLQRRVRALEIKDAVRRAELKEPQAGKPGTKKAPKGRSGKRK